MLCNVGTGFVGIIALGTHYIDVDGTVVLGGSNVAGAGAKVYCSTTFSKYNFNGAPDFPANLTIEMDGTGTLY